MAFRPRSRSTMKPPSPKNILLTILLLLHPGERLRRHMSKIMICVEAATPDKHTCKRFSCPGLICQRSDSFFTAAELIFNLLFPCFFFGFLGRQVFYLHGTPNSCPTICLLPLTPARASGNADQTFPPWLHQSEALPLKTSVFFLRPGFISLPLSSEGFRTRKTFFPECSLAQTQA